MPSRPLTLTALHDEFRSGTLRPSDVVESWLALPHAARAAPVWIATLDAATLRARRLTRC